MLKVTGLRVRLDDASGDIRPHLAAYLGITTGELESVEILRKALDARKKSGLSFVYTLNVGLRGGAEKSPSITGHSGVSPAVVVEPPVVPVLTRPPARKPVVVGMGPAGLFAALLLAKAGACPVVLERGSKLGKRVSDTVSFWEGRGLDTGSNVQFGEGGAGTFSDGKLTTRITDPRVRLVLRTLVEMGAPDEILYEAKPHIGTDRLRRLVVAFRKRLVELGADIRFNAKVDGLVVGRGRVAGLSLGGERMETGDVILAPGNAARDTFEMLRRAGVAMLPKPFAIGIRVEHPREHIDRIQYGAYAGHPMLGAADYMLTYNDRKTGRAAYTFCMCPGGHVVAASSEPGGVVVNGMSDYKRDSLCSNSAIVVTVRPEDFGSDDPLGGVSYQRRWERAAFEAGGGGYFAPAQDMHLFLSGRPGGELAFASYRPGVSPADLTRCLPEFVPDVLKRALRGFDSRARGFIHPDATLTGVETRTSSPVKIVRGEDFQSVSLRGIYPCGEGSGYAGGIVSSAVDGMKAAEKLIESLATGS